MSIIDLIKKKTAKHHERSKTMARLAELTDELDNVDFEIIAYGTLLRSVNDSLTYAIWAKDVGGTFMYANRLCREKLMHCTESDVLKGNFKIDDKLSIMCSVSDEIVKNTQKPLRFIEHNKVWWDTLKLPMYNNDGDRLIGTIGEARDITNLIPDHIKAQTNESGAIPIELDVVLSKDEIKKILLTR